MPTQLLKRRGRPPRITDKQRVWINEYIIDMNGARAARVAGFKHPDVAGAKLLNPVRYPLVAAEVRKVLAEKELRAEKKADDVLRYIHTAMFFQPLRYFLPGEDGGWFIDEDKVDSLPPHIGCLIEEVELRRVVIGTGKDRQEVTKLWVRLVSKTAAMTLAAKHQLGDRVQATVTQHMTFDWSDMTKSRYEEAMAEAKALVQPVVPPSLPCGLKELTASESALSVNRLACGPSRNGDGHE